MDIKRLTELAGMIVENQTPTRTIQIQFTPELIAKVREFNRLADSDEETVREVNRFLDEISTPHGLASVLDSLDWFNY